MLSGCIPGTEDRLFDVAQPVLAEINLVNDEKGRGAESAARRELLGIPKQALFDRWILDSHERAGAVEPGGIKRRADHIGVVISAAIAPRMIGSVLTAKEGLR